MTQLLQSTVQHVSTYSFLLIQTGLILVAFWLLSVFVVRTLRRTAKKLSLDAVPVRLTIALIRLALLTVGIITTLGTAGVNIAALVASLGLTGFALGFAFRDALSNLIAGLLILFYKRFQTGDTVTVAGFEGVVQTIDLRYRTLQTSHKDYLIPNSLLFSNPMTVIKAARPKS